MKMADREPNKPQYDDPKQKPGQGQVPNAGADDPVKKRQQPDSERPDEDKERRKQA
jgi:hypothetical protein